MMNLSNFPWTLMFLFIPVFCFESAEIPNSNDSLIFAQILFRHGDRNILKPYKNDPWFDEKYWLEGFGQLTQIGKMQMFELGAYLRRRYFKLIPENGQYHANTVYVQSTDVDRTLSSAAYALAAMFPPMNEQIWHKSLMWQAIPIHTTQKYLDYILSMDKPCPLHSQALKEYTASADVQLMLKNNQSFFKYVEKYSGEKIRSFLDVQHIHETLVVENFKNLRVPNWTESVFDQIEECSIFSHKMDTNTKLLARLKAGFLIREIFERFTMKKDSTLTPNRVLWVYSAHDETIINVLNALNLFEPQMPPYASCLLFELHQINGTFHVELYYKQERGEDKVPLQALFIPNCGQKCPLSKLYEIYDDIIPTEDFDTECRLPSASPLQRNIKSGSGLTADILSSLWLIVGLLTALAASASS